MYNMANSNQIVTIKELADILTKNVFKERNLNVIVEKQAIMHNNYKTIVNTKKLENLGWKPVIGIEEGFRRLIDSLEKDYAVERQRTRI